MRKGTNAYQDSLSTTLQNMLALYKEQEISTEVGEQKDLAFSECLHYFTLIGVQHLKYSCVNTQLFFLYIHFGAVFYFFCIYPIIKTYMY